jgi:hypothetical protein
LQTSLACSSSSICYCYCYRTQRATSTAAQAYCCYYGHPTGSMAEIGSAYGAHEPVRGPPLDCSKSLAHRLPSGPQAMTRRPHWPRGPSAQRVGCQYSASRKLPAGSSRRSTWIGRSGPRPRWRVVLDARPAVALLGPRPDDGDGHGARGTGKGPFRFRVQAAQWAASGLTTRMTQPAAGLLQSLHGTARRRHRHTDTAQQRRSSLYFYS